MVNKGNNNSSCVYRGICLHFILYYTGDKRLIMQVKRNDYKNEIINHEVIYNNCKFQSQRRTEEYY